MLGGLNILSKILQEEKEKVVELCIELQNLGAGVLLICCCYQDDNSLFLLVILPSAVPL